MHRISIKLLPYIALGGALGAIFRWQLDLLINSQLASLLVINLSGSLLIGVAAGAVTSKAMQSFFQIGFLGSFTSMSAVIALLSPEFTSGNSIMLVIVTFVLAPLFASQGLKLAGERK